MHDEYIGKSWSAWVALTVMVVALFLFTHSQECSVSPASLILLLPF